MNIENHLNNMTIFFSKKTGFTATVEKENKSDVLFKFNASIFSEKINKSDEYTFKSNCSLLSEWIDIIYF